MLSIVLFVVPGGIFAQDSSSRSIIKDSTQLAEEIDQLRISIKQHDPIDIDRVKEIMQYFFEEGDSSKFFVFVEKELYTYFLEEELSLRGISFFKELQSSLSPNPNPFGDFNNVIGNMYLELDRNTEALNYYFKSVEWSEKYNEIYTTYPLGNIAEVYFRNENYKKSLEYNELTLSYSLRMPEGRYKNYCLIYDYFRIATVHYKLQNFEKASKFYTNSLAVFDEYDNPKLMLYAISIALTFYSDIKDYDKCKSLINDGDSIINNDSLSVNEYWIKDYIISRSKHYLKIGRHDKAIQPNKLEMMTEIKSKELYQYSIDYFKSKNDMDNASVYFEKLIEESLNQNKQNKSKLYSSIEENYLAKKLKRENANLIFDIKRRQRNMNYILVAMGFVLLLLILQFINSRRFKEVNTLLKKNQDELETSNLKLTAANEELERFVHIASHDLKTPLSSIINFTGLLDQELNLPSQSKHQKYLNLIKDEGVRLNTIIRDTLEYSLLTHKEQDAEAINLNLLVHEVKESLIKSTQKENVQIAISVNLPTLIANRPSIMSLIQNLLENGIQYNSSDKPSIKVWFELTEEHFKLFIEDNGIGIGEEYHEKVFTMFSRLHNYSDYRGTGLGLAICKKIMNGLDGDIYLKSKNGQGCLFVLDFPIHLIYSKTLDEP
jgi:signal transduction histidine kinase